MRAQRLISLLLHLQARGRVSGRELAAELGVSLRTVQRDVEALVEAGVAVRAERGMAGGYSVPRGYQSRLAGLSRDEAAALFLAGTPGPAHELGLAAVLTSAQLKVLASMPAELRHDATRAAQLFHLDPPPWFEKEERAPHLLTVAGALWQGRRLDARYRDGRGKPVRRVLSPLGLVLKSGVWYLIAGNRGEIRGYRVGRFTGVSVRRDAGVRPDGFDLARFWAGWLDEFEASRPRIDVAIRIEPSAIAGLTTALGAQARAEVAEAARGARLSNGMLRISVSFERIDDAKRALLGLGDRVEVLGPPEFRRAISSTARAVTKLYARRARRAGAPGPR
jgi:predicted DNA-binding transcriptional regulator YafY